MLARLLTTALAAAFLIGAVASRPAYAAKKNKDAATEESATPEKKKGRTAQQQKMKDCAVKWGEEKKAKNVKGRKAYNAFMSTCLKA
jgi:hypothetical protein